jgi:hypothetical protein
MGRLRAPTLSSSVGLVGADGARTAPALKTPNFTELDSK